MVAVAANSLSEMSTLLLYGIPQPPSKSRSSRRNLSHSTCQPVNFRTQSSCPHQTLTTLTDAARPPKAMIPGPHWDETVVKPPIFLTVRSSTSFILATVSVAVFTDIFLFSVRPEERAVYGS